MHETPEDLSQLQKLLDDSYASSGKHLLSIHTPDRRLTASQLSEILTGVRVLALATVTARGEPMAGAVDGLFYRGRFWFGSSHESVRFRHIRARPQVSAVHTVGEELAVTVHGLARETMDDGFRAYLTEIYGPDWEDWGGDSPYAMIEPRRMFTFRMRAAGEPPKEVET